MQKAVPREENTVVPDPGQKSRLLYAIGVGLFAVALAAGVVQSLRVDKRLPAIDLLMNGSQAYIDRQDPDGAIEQLDMQARILPDDAGTRERLGKLLLRQGRSEEARVQFQQLVRLRPEDAHAFTGLGLAWVQLGEVAAAEKCFARAVELAPNSTEAQNLLEMARRELQGPDGAKKGG